MLNVALNTLVALSRKSAEPMTLDVSHQSKTYSVGGELKTVETAHPPRCHKVEAVEDFIQATNDFDEDADKDVVVWFDKNGVVAVLDDDKYRVSRVTLPLEFSGSFHTLRNLSPRQYMSQKDFIRLLRIDLAGTLDPAILLERVRKVRVENGQITTGVIRKNEESLGRSVTAKIEMEGEIPDEVTLTLPVYRTKGLQQHYDVRCAVEIEQSNAQFRLTPLPDELDRVIEFAMQDLRVLLAEGLNDIDHYYGSA